MCSIVFTYPELRKTYDLFNLVRFLVPKQKIIIVSRKKSRLLKIIYSKAEFYTDYSFLSEKKEDEYIALPIEETSLLEYYKLKETHSNISSLLSSIDDFSISRDKYKLMEFCYKESIPSPITFFSKNELLDNNIFPILAKRRIGEGSKGMKKLTGKKNLVEFLKNNRFEEYVFQEFIEGERNVFGAFFLFNNGKLESWNGHNRIRTYPVKGGVSVFSKETKNDILCEIGENILKKLNWSGIAMIEFMYDKKDNEYKVIEINPRLWGSILLSGNLIKKYLEISLNKEIVKAIYKKEYIDWYFPGEFLFTLSTFKFFSFFKNSFYLYKYRKNINFIGFSYSKLINALLFVLFQLFQIDNFSKIKKKLFK